MSKKPPFPESLLEDYPSKQDLEEIGFCRKVLNSHERVDRNKYNTYLLKHIVGRPPTESEKYYIYEYIKNYYRKFRKSTTTLRYGLFTLPLVLIVSSILFNWSLVARILIVLVGILIFQLYRAVYVIDIQSWEVLRDIKKGNYRVYRGNIKYVLGDSGDLKCTVSFKRGDGLPLVSSQEIYKKGVTEGSSALCISLGNKNFSDKEGPLKIITKYMLSDEGMKIVKNEFNSLGLLKIEEKAEQQKGCTKRD